MFPEPDGTIGSTHMLRLRSVSTGTPDELETVEEVLDIQDISLTESQENILPSADESTVEGVYVRVQTDKVSQYARSPILIRL